MSPTIICVMTTRFHESFGPNFLDTSNTNRGGKITKAINGSIAGFSSGVHIQLPNSPGTAKQLLRTDTESHVPPHKSTTCRTNSTKISKIFRFTMLRTETLHRTGTSFGSLDLAVARSGLSLQIFQKVIGGMGDFVNGAIEGSFVGGGWFLKARNLADVLQRRSPHFIAGGMRFKVIKSLNISTHNFMIPNKKTSEEAFRLIKIGGPSGTRTQDTRLKRPLL